MDSWGKTFQKERIGGAKTLGHEHGWRTWEEQKEEAVARAGWETWEK